MPGPVAVVDGDDGDALDGAGIHISDAVAAGGSDKGGDGVAG